MSNNQIGLLKEDNLLVELSRRAAMFESLREQPLPSCALERRLDMSRSTIHRATQSLEGHGLLRKRGEKFELTGLGRVAASRILDLRFDLEAAVKIEPFLNTVGATAVDIPVDLFADAEITYPQPRQAHFGGKRIVERIEESESLRMFSSIISPFYVEVAHREMLDGMEIEVVFDVEVIDIIVDRYAEQAMEAARTGRFDVYVHDDVPFELFLFDDSVGMAAHDENGIARAFVETDAVEAMEWAADQYDRHREAAEAITLLDHEADAIEQL